jgi:hypothetical protein
MSVAAGWDGGCVDRTFHRATVWHGSEEMAGVRGRSDQDR